VISGSIDDTIAYLDSVHRRTMRVVECIPPDQLEWRPAAGMFSLGDLVRHLAAINRYMFVEIACGRSSAYPGHGEELATGKDAVLAYKERLHTEGLRLLQELTPDRWDSHCTTPEGAKIRVWKWIRAMVEHENHHRGQVYSYLAQLRVPTPPIFGLTSEQVRANSASTTTAGEVMASD
jgi:uncharacterized damage-inducible protein DinB